jgi:hypothetical protein
MMAMAAQQSALAGQAIKITEDGHNFEAWGEEFPACTTGEKREETCRN